MIDGIVVVIILYMLFSVIFVLFYDSNTVNMILDHTVCHYVCMSDFTTIQILE